MKTEYREVVRRMLKKIYLELILIRKELQAIRSSKEFKAEQIITTENITCRVR